MKERYVWSPDHGGCLMIQRQQPDKSWINWSSQEEGEYPEHDDRAKRAVAHMNAWAKSRKFLAKAKDHEQRGAILRQRAIDVCQKVGLSFPPPL